MVTLDGIPPDVTHLYGSLDGIPPDVNHLYGHMRQDSS